jgi:hypothetical protein
MRTKRKMKFTKPPKERENNLKKLKKIIKSSLRKRRLRKDTRKRWLKRNLRSKKKLRDRRTQMIDILQCLRS